MNHHFIICILFRRISATPPSMSWQQPLENEGWREFNPFKSTYGRLPGYVKRAHFQVIITILADLRFVTNNAAQAYIQGYPKRRTTLAQQLQICLQSLC